MKSTLPLLICLFLCNMAISQTQDYNKHLSKEDAARADTFLHKAFSVRLFSNTRQLYLDSALQINPENAYYWQQKSMPLFKQRKYEAGLPFLDNAVKYDPWNYMNYRAYMKCVFQKNYTGAIEDFKEARKLNGESYVMDHPYDFYTGISYLQLNRIDSADYYLTKCMDDRRKKMGEDAMHHLHWFYLGVIQFEKNDYKNAIASFDQALKIYKQFSDVKYYKALCLAYTGDYKQALKWMEEAKADLAEGYTINEDNVIYEPYPYQINDKWVEGNLMMLKEKNGIPQ